MSGRAEALFAGPAVTFFAPMEGVTSPPLRELYAARGGIQVVCTEFVRITSQALSPKTLAKHVVRPTQGLLSVQVMGNNIQQMAEATELVTLAGADIVDINLGCPAPKAVRKGVGSAMLSQPALIGEVVARMRERTDLPLSAKIRAGFDRADQFIEVAKRLEGAGIDFLTVHPRRRVDFYSGVADWRIIRTLSDSLSIPVVGNGDIWYASDALRIGRETRCRGVMLGRPALRNPWIFLQIAALKEGRGDAPRPQGRDLVAHLQALARLFADALDARSVTGLVKEQLRYLGRAVKDDGAFLKAALRLEHFQDILALADSRLAQLASEELDLEVFPGGLERSGSVEAPAGAESTPEGLEGPSVYC